MQELKIFSGYDSTIVAQDATNFIKDKVVMSLDTTTTDVGGKPFYTTTVIIKNAHYEYLKYDEVAPGVSIKTTKK